MIRTNRSFPRAAAGLALALCAMLAALACLRTAEPVVYHSLEALPAQPAGPRPGPALEVLPVRLPESLRRPQLLESLGPGRFGLVSGHRWGNPLDQEVQRVLVADLAALLGGATVVPSPYGPRVGAAWRIEVQVQDWSVRPGEVLVLEATWMLARPDAERAERFRRTRIIQPLDGPGPDALAAAHGRAVAALAGELAEAVRSFP